MCLTKYSMDPFWMWGLQVRAGGREALSWVPQGNEPQMALALVEAAGQLLSPQVPCSGRLGWACCDRGGLHGACMHLSDCWRPTCPLCTPTVFPAAPLPPPPSCSWGMRPAHWQAPWWRSWYAACLSTWHPTSPIWCRRVLQSHQPLRS
jgi:hypothetical protein